MMYQRALIIFAFAAPFGCSKTDYYTGAFSAPSHSAVVMPSDDTPFSEPVGFVANRKGGQIAIVALQSGRFMTDDTAASFIRGNPLATGRKRIMSSIATWTRPGKVSVFAGDQSYKQLLEVPYLTSVEAGQPIEQGVSATDPVFNDVDGSGDAARLGDLMVQSGFTSTEDWTITLRGDGWWVEGSRSGQLELPATTGEEYVDGNGVISFTITGTATEGDTFAFSSDSGLLEHDVGGFPLHLSMSPDQDLMALVVQAAGGSRTLNWWNPSAHTLTTIPLPTDSAPGRMTWSEDGSTLFVSDETHPGVWSVAKGQTLPTELALPWPTIEVAALDAGPVPSLFVVPASNRSVWRYDLSTNQLIDLNPETPAIEGLELDTPIRGLEAIPIKHLLGEYTAEGIQRQGRSVAVALYSGPVVFLDEETGCLVQDELGPRTVPSNDFGATYDYGSNAQSSSGPFMEANLTNDRHVVVNGCSGIAQTEFWTLTFDENRQGWEVDGSVSGIQSDLALEDTRYVTRDGAVSFVIRSGSTPTADGTTFKFSVNRGSLEANGDNDRDGQIGEGEFALSLPSDPVFFSYRDRSPDGGWQTAEDHAMLFVASEGSNFTTRINATDASLEIIWE